jgi:hypothetical protein
MIYSKKKIGPLGATGFASAFSYLEQALPVRVFVSIKSNGAPTTVPTPWLINEMKNG